MTEYREDQAIRKYAKDNYCEDKLQYTDFSYEEIVGRYKDGSDRTKTIIWKLNKYCFDVEEIICIFACHDEVAIDPKSEFYIDTSGTDISEVARGIVSDEQLAEWRGVFVEFLKSKNLISRICMNIKNYLELASKTNKNLLDALREDIYKIEHEMKKIEDDQKNEDISIENTYLEFTRDDDGYVSIFAGSAHKKFYLNSVCPSRDHCKVFMLSEIFGGLKARERIQIEKSLKCLQMEKDALKMQIKALEKCNLTLKDQELL